MSSDLTIQQGQEDLHRAQMQSLVEKPPCQVPGYEMERHLGSGAFGEVWVAVEKNTNRRVAIKFFSHARGDWSQLNREVERLAFLSADRYVVQLLEVGWTSTPPYYVMEYLEHGSLEDRLKQEPYNPAAATAMFREIAQALVHAHGKGVLHCDLKPANVLLDEDETPRLADFGQSRLSHEETPALGTLFYMAPEQARLDSMPDARWDVYALGAVMYRMLTGQPPYKTPEFEAELEAAHKLEDRLKIYRDLLRKSPLPTGHRHIPGVDKGLADVVDRCLAFSESKRFPNAQAVVDSLNLLALRKARRPLLLLGALVPAFLLGITAVIGWITFTMVVAETEKALVDGSVESNRFAARFVAETAARDIDRRWQILETEALRLAPLLVKVGGKTGKADLNTPERAALQRRMVRAHEAYQEVAPATSWFLVDATGMQLARSPVGETIGQRWSHRDYFHGKGEDVPEGTKNVAPIEHPHRSAVYESGSTRNRTVAFSVPIRSDDEARTVIGVVGMSVPVGGFGEMRSSAEENQPQIAALADVRPLRDGQDGLILQHPSLADEVARRERGEDVKVQKNFMSPEMRKFAESVREDRLKQIRRNNAPIAMAPEPAGTAVGAASVAGTTVAATTSAATSATSAPAISSATPSATGTASAGTTAVGTASAGTASAGTASVGTASVGTASAGTAAATTGGAAPAATVAVAAAPTPVQQQTALAKKRAAQAQGIKNWTTEYEDPMAASDPRYAGRWVAVVEPIIVEGRKEFGDTGWVAIVQERYESATGAVSQMRSSLFRLGIVFYGVILLFLTGAWAFLFRVLNDTSRRSVWKKLRVGPLGDSSGTHSSGSTGRGGTAASGGLSGSAGTGGSGVLSASATSEGGASEDLRAAAGPSARNGG